MALSHLTRDKVLHRIKADRIQLQSRLYSVLQIIHAEAFQKAQYLDILSALHLQHARLHQAALSWLNFAPPFSVKSK